MISKQTIQAMAGLRTYLKGEQIYEQNKVLQFSVDVDVDSDCDEVTALVKGSGSKLYEVYIRIDWMTDEIEDIDCECPAFYSYDSICKHCVAVLLKYIDYCELNEMQEQNEYDQMDLFADSPLPIKKGAKRPTTDVLHQILQEKESQRRFPLIDQEAYGNVHLESTLQMDRESAYLTFKIGISQMYVLKDVFEFVRLIEQGTKHRYGKKLEFIHSMEAFDEESKPLVEFIEQWTSENQERYRSQNYYSYYNYGYALPKSKELYLDTTYMAQYLEIVRGQTFIAYLPGMKEHEWTVTDEALPRSLKLTGDGDGVSLELQRFLGFELRHGYVYFHDGLVYLEPIAENKVVKQFIRAMGVLPDRTAYISKEDLPTFCHELLPALEEYYKCEFVDFDKEQYGIPTPEFLVYLDAPQTNMITCRPRVKYGEHEYSLYENRDIANRNIEEELAVRKLVHEYGNAFDQESGSVVAIDDDEAIYELLIYGVPRMQKVAEVFISDAIKRMEVKKAPKITVGVSVESGLMNLTMDSGEMSREELIDILFRYSRKKKFYRLKDGSFINAENAGFEEILELKEGLQLTDKQMRQEQIQLNKYRSLYVDEQLKDSSTISSIRDRSFRELIRNMKTIEDNDFEIPVQLENTLREYQKKGFLWLKTLKHNGFGGILADDMGLGKTLQVITFLLSEYHENPSCGKTIIVTPASLVFNWYEEFQKFAPELSVVMAAGNVAQRKELITHLSESDILITSYDLLKRDIDLYEQIVFETEIIDEAQYIKNHNTQAARAVKDIEASFKIALTGTPVENRLSELWSIFDYLMPGFLYGYKKFRDELEGPIVTNQDEDAAKRLRKMIHPFVLRRLKKDVLKDLPDKLEENVYAKMDVEQQKVYDAHVQRLKILLDKQTDEEFKNSKLVVLSELTKLRQLCCDPSLILENYKGGSAKKDMCITFIQNAVDNGHKVLLFSQFTTMLSELAEALQKAGISYYMLTGATSKEKRRQLVNAFNQDDTSVFCISLKAGGTGLNLTAADIVIHYDPWWNLAVQNQATDRAHRIGQEHIVNVYKLIVKGSIEENIIKMQEKKKELADQILSGEGMDGGNFTREELLEILS